MLRAALELVRPSSTLLAFVAILVPIFSRTGDLTASLKRSIPLLLASACTFLINDLDDMEKDSINHPQRPLPSGRVTPSVVTSLYFMCLAGALITTRMWVQRSHVAFLYYAGLTIAISYSYIVEYLPALKAPYVAAASMLPVLILTEYFPDEPGLYRIAAAVFLSVLGRELCKDILDRKGDPASLLHRINEHDLAIIAFVSQAAAVLLVSIRLKSAADVADVTLMSAALATAALCWFRLGKYQTATTWMKTVVLFGLFFLIKHN